MTPNTILSPKLNTSHRPEFNYLGRHCHFLTIIIFSTNPTGSRANNYNVDI